ncbi:Hypothetical predicted protein, partial [Marmota monax]
NYEVAWTVCDPRTRRSFKVIQTHLWALLSSLPLSEAGAAQPSRRFSLTHKDKTCVFTGDSGPSLVTSTRV